MSDMQVQAELKLKDNLSKPAGTALEALGKSAAKTGTAVDAIGKNQGMQRTAKDAADAARNMSGMARTAQETSRGIDAAALSAKRFRDGAQDAARLIASMRNNMQGVQRTIRDAAGQMQGLGRGAATAMRGAAALGTAGYVAKAALDKPVSFESKSLDAANTIYGDIAPGERIKKASQLRAQAFEAARKYGGGADQAMEIIQGLAAGGLDGDSIDRLLPTALKTVVAGKLQSKDVTNLLPKGLKNKMFTLDQADLAMDEGLKGGKQGSFEFKDMAKYLPQFAALGTGMKSHAGYQMHIANAEAIETVSADPDQAGNNYINLLQKLNAPDVKNNFKKKGINLTKVQLQAASKGIDPVTAMADAVESLMHKSKGYQKLKKKLAAAQNDDERRQIYLARTSMHRIDSSTATPDGRFTEGNPTIPVPATTVTADWLNAMQEEAIAVLAAAGIAPDKANNAQMLAAILKLIADSTPSIATSQENGIGRPDGITITIDASGKYTATTRPFILGEFYYFRHPSLRTGFAPCQGGILANAVTQHPEIWAYLQTAEGQLLLKTEAEWQAMSTATWATLADGTKVGWNGIGGVPYYVQDLATGIHTARRDALLAAVGAATTAEAVQAIAVSYAV